MLSKEQRTRLPIELGIARERNRALLTDSLAQEAVVHLNGEVPADVDACVIDEATFNRTESALEAWSDAQHPTAAPVLLLTESGDPSSTQPDFLQYGTRPVLEHRPLQPSSELAVKELLAGSKAVHERAAAARR